MRETGGADAIMPRVDVGEEASDSDGLGLGELEAVGDAMRESGTRRRRRAARLSTASSLASGGLAPLAPLAALVALAGSTSAFAALIAASAGGLAVTETGRCRFADAATPNAAQRRYRQQRASAATHSRDDLLLRVAPARPSGTIRSSYTLRTS